MMLDKYLNKVTCGDCLEVMKELPDKCIDLVLTSPPYNTGGKNLGYQPNSTIGQSLYGEYSDSKKEIEYTEWIINVIDECLKKSRYVFWNMQYIVSTKKTITEIQYKFKDNLKDIFIWQKQAVAQICVKNSPILANGYEFVFMFGQDNSKIFKYSNFPDNGYVPNIKTWYKRESFKEHHATYTREMCNYFIEYFTKDNDIVLDPFFGVGTTGVSAESLKRNWIGIEISPEYCKIAEERIKKERNQLKLF